MGSHSLLQGIFLTQGSNLCLLHCRLILYHLNKLIHSYFSILWMKWGFPGGSDGKESAHSEGDLGLIPGLGRSPGAGHGNSLQYSCLENPRGQRSLVGYSPWSCKETDTTEQLSTHGWNRSLNCSITGHQVGSSTFLLCVYINLPSASLWMQILPCF